MVYKCLKPLLKSFDRNSEAVECVLCHYELQRHGMRSRKLKAFFKKTKRSLMMWNAFLTVLFWNAFHFFWDTFFLKKGLSLFWNAFSAVIFDDYFSLG
jgi:hypothetical protein